MLVRNELALFAAFWIIVGLADELAVDLCYLALRLTGSAQTSRLSARLAEQPLSGRTAVFIPTWREAAVIGLTLREALRVWVDRKLVIYVGCYRNDHATIAAVLRATDHDPRVRLVIHGHDGPTTKADCLNRLYTALCTDEARWAEPARTVLLHDAEDLVHPAALAAIDQALDDVDFVQLPVLPEPNPRSAWIAGHYTDEFAEAHGKLLVVRSAVSKGVPAAGVGCGINRAALAQFARQRMAAGEAGPFAADCLTEDYELGLLLSRQGRGGAFLRQRAADGSLIATRSYFPAELEAAVKQKTRWIHGIAFQSWERLGWQGRPFELWMALRDRRGPLTALVLTCAYALLVIEGLIHAGGQLGLVEPIELDPLLKTLLVISLGGLVWRVVWRCLFVWREYGVIEAVRSIARVPVGNVIAIMAGRRALAAYMRSLAGGRLEWDKTVHFEHPARRSAAATTRIDA